jgi:aminoacyl-tRNA hydrolase
MLARLVAVLLMLPCIVFAQSYPSKAVRLIVPFPPGGTTDLIARVVQPKFQEALGQNVIIENKGGAGGAVGAAEAAQAPADGYTLLLVFDTHAVNHHIYKVAPDPFTRFEHLMLMVTSPSTLVATMRFPVASLRDFFSVSPDHIVVVHDELDLPFGTLRIKRGGGDNGHNGLRSVRASLGTGDYIRVRFGIGRPPGRTDPAAFVLKPFSAAERKELELEVDRAADAVEALVVDGLTYAQNHYNS